MLQRYYKFFNHAINCMINFHVLCLFNIHFPLHNFFYWQNFAHRLFTNPPTSGNKNHRYWFIDLEEWRKAPVPVTPRHSNQASLLLCSRLGVLWLDYIPKIKTRKSAKYLVESIFYCTFALKNKQYGKTRIFTLFHIVCISCRR